MEERFRRFAMTTTIHGVRDFSTSDAWWKKLFWAFALISCTGFFIWHAQLQATQCLEGKPTVTMKTLSLNERYIFPPMILAIPDWIWIDKSKLSAYNITSEEFILAKSFLRKGLHYHSTVPIESVKESLEKKARAAGITGAKFFQSLARPDAAGLKFYVDPQNAQNYGQYPITRKMFFEEDCFYVLNTNGSQKSTFGQFYQIAYEFNVSRYLQIANDQTTDLLPENHFPKEEYRFDQIEPWLQNAYFHTRMKMKPGFQYTVYFSIQIYRPLTRDCLQVLDGDPWFDRETCSYNCKAKANLSFSLNSCYRGWQFALDLNTGVWPLCSRGFFVNKTSTNNGQMKPIFRNLTRDESIRWNNMIKECIRKECMPPCSHWMASTSFMYSKRLTDDGTADNNSILINIFYPNRNAITVMEEIESYYWYDLFSSIGGSLGLCLGASLMSIFQLFLLCPSCNRYRSENASVKDDCDQSKMKASIGGLRNGSVSNGSHTTIEMYM